MPRAIWSGSISFGLVNVPVKLYSAIHHEDLRFHQFEEGTNARVRNKRVSEKTGKEVAYDDIVKGYEVSKGQYVMVDPDELAEFNPRSTRTIDIEDFVALADIDPIFYNATYYLAPEKSDGAKKAFGLLREAMEQQGKVAIGRLVMRTKQYLAAIRPYEKGLALSTMLFHDEIVPVSEIPEVPSRSGPKVAPAELKMASQIIDSLTRDWEPKRYEDTYRVQVLDFLKKKAAGEEIVVEEEQEEESNVVDLMAALEASLEAAKKGGSRKGPLSAQTSSVSSSSKSTASKATKSSKASKASKASKTSETSATKSSKSTPRPAKRSSTRSTSGTKRKSA